MFKYKSFALENLLLILWDEKFPPSDRLHHLALECPLSPWGQQSRKPKGLKIVWLSGVSSYFILDYWTVHRKIRVFHISIFLEKIKKDTIISQIRSSHISNPWKYFSEQSPGHENCQNYKSEASVKVYWWMIDITLLPPV